MKQNEQAGSNGKNISEEIKVNKKLNVIIGLLLVVFAALYFTELVKALIISLLLNYDSELILNGILISLRFTSPNEIETFPLFLILSSPILSVIICNEISSIILSKAKKFNLKNILIVFQLGLSGFLIFNIFFGIISVVLNLDSFGSWNYFIQKTDYSLNQKLFFMLFMVITAFTYISFLSNRIKNYFQRN